MRKLFFLASLLSICLGILFLSHYSFAAGVTLVQKNFQNLHTSSNAVSFPSSTTTGNTIIVAITQFNATVTGVTDTKGNTYTPVTPARHANASTDYAQLYYAKNITGGTDTVTVSFSASTDTNVGVYEYVGLSATPLDQTVSNVGISTTPTGGNLVTTTDGQLYFAVGVDDNGNNNGVTAGSGYTLENQQDDSSTHERFYSEDKVVNHGTIATNFIIGVSSHFAVLAASFKPSTGPTPTPTPTFTPTPTSTPTPTGALTPTPTPTLPPGAPTHTLIVVEENHQLQQALSVDYFTFLASQGALMVNSFGVTHPSTPNYFALFSGSLQGTTDNTCPPVSSPFSTQNLASQLSTKGLTFTGYAESPYPSCVGTFAWEWFSNVPASDAQDFSAFPSTNFATLPTVSWLAPTLINNAHDGTLQQASDWLRAHVESYRAWAITNNSLLIITFDEDDEHENNLVYTVFVGPMVKPGIYNEHINHYNVLSTLERLYGLPQISTASPITDIFK